jgi:DNA repair exonuclease SbcCD ATPase subunit
MSKDAKKKEKLRCDNCGADMLRDGHYSGCHRIQEAAQAVERIQTLRADVAWLEGFLVSEGYVRAADGWRDGTTKNSTIANLRARVQDDEEKLLEWKNTAQYWMERAATAQNKRDQLQGQADACAEYSELADDAHNEMLKERDLREVAEGLLEVIAAPLRIDGEEHMAVVQQARKYFAARAERAKNQRTITKRMFALKPQELRTSPPSTKNWDWLLKNGMAGDKPSP